MHDRRGDLEPLLHPGRIRLDAAVPRFAQADVVENLVGPLQGVARVHADKLARVSHELDPDHAGKQALVLGNETDGLADVHPAVANVHAQHPTPAGVQRDQPEQAADHRRLARPIGTEKADRPFRHRPATTPTAP